MTLWRADRPLVLASQSKVRRAVLEAAGVPVEIVIADIDERGVEARSGLTDPGAVAALLAREKAAAVSASMAGRLVLGADQTLALDKQRFSKAPDRAGARAQLRALRGKTHALHSAVALLRNGNVLYEHVAVARLRQSETGYSSCQVWPLPALCAPLRGWVNRPMVGHGAAELRSSR